MASSNSSSSRCEIKMTAVPLSRNWRTMRNSSATSASVSDEVRLVHDQDFGVDQQGAGDLDHLLLATLGSARLDAGVEMDAQLRQQPPRFLHHLPPGDPPAGSGEFSGSPPMLSVMSRSGKRLGSW